MSRAARRALSACAAARQSAPRPRLPAGDLAAEQIDDPRWRRVSAGHVLEMGAVEHEHGRLCAAPGLRQG